MTTLPSRLIYLLNRVEQLIHQTWSGKRVSNSRPQPWQGCALPTELFPQIHFIHVSMFFWSGKRVSNSRPQPWQGCALPTELFPQIHFIHVSMFFWSGKRVSNSRPQPWQGCALPTELFPRCSFVLNEEATLYR